MESVKSASDIYAPLSGQVFEVNEALNSKPSLINQEAEGKGNNFLLCTSNFLGWLCKIAVSEMDSEIGSLLTQEQYDELLASQHDEEGEEEEEEQTGEPPRKRI